MSLKRQYERLMEYPDANELHDSAAPDVLNRAEVCGIKLPTPLIELLSLFDGGELFVPGTVVYGLIRHGKMKSLTEANSSHYRSLFTLPDTCVIFAELNYGDFICIDSKDNSVIQWDHEKDEQYQMWSSLEEWLAETIDAYRG